MDGAGARGVGAVDSARSDPGNICHGSGHAFATDPLARHYVAQALEAGFDRRVEPAMRMFFYLPFEHSEALADQERSVALFERLGDARTLEYAIAHRDVIVRFNRFPHRNRALGRPDTPESALIWTLAAAWVDVG